MMRSVHIFFAMVAGLAFCNPCWAKDKSPEDGLVSILFVGDIVLDGKPGKMIEDGRDPFADFAPILANADIRIGNLECVVATVGNPVDKNFNFRAHPRSLAVLKRHFDAVGIANNHSGDFGREAFREMLGLLDQQKIPHFGGGQNLPEAHKPLIIESKGLRIAFLAYNEFMPRSFEADAKAAGIAWSEDEQVVDDIRKARSVYKADLVIPFMHWGWENELLAGDRQRKLAHIMIKAGADAVIGGHPHVIQDVEHYQGKPIIYSIGNFMIDALDNEAQTKGWVVRLHVNRQGVQAWDTRLAKIDEDGIPHPVVDAQTSCWNRTDNKLTPCAYDAVHKQQAKQ
ncbi:CapA family protein [Undibacterium sp. RTI2.1]|uniref:CapA family protein n=1 Tax=unclassified Undibacterium TaxID=2630295 RepID=UPI002B2396B6|nr:MULTISPECIES: CapA family protein [unclassified Undibacterium]MEB0032275.1 CapA family protein [Undibacterium sp. RTI2.1]MEB0118411.1 CapA family protein [Undibacterium sp. RTI2.2]